MENVMQEENKYISRILPVLMFLPSIIIVAVAMSGCGQMERVGAKFTGYSEICVDGVQYLQFTSGASVKYNADGSIVTCN
jgi:hypothetical protein